ncbi:hypothetical protein [Paraburkholderia sp. WSM4179]|nr:hypothetical protein [Paraburkholderia sp. WSM4179]MDH6148378.1 hypothetical protein [Paraburkholderia sp. WSM4179]
MDRFIRWFAWPMCALVGLSFLVLLYTVAPAMQRGHPATHQWQALTR